VHPRSVTSQLMRGIAVLLTLVMAMAGLSATAVSAQSNSASDGDSHRPNLVVLGDSFASGVGNTRYQTGTEETCKRSDSAYGELLEDWGLVHLQSSAACSGATTVQVWGPGLAGGVPQPPQIDSITADTDLVTVQALGNDFYFGTISGLCIVGDCSAEAVLLPPNVDPNYPDGARVSDILASIPEKSPALLAKLFGDIKQKIADEGSRAKIIVVEYGNPYPPPGKWVGPFCPAEGFGHMSDAELLTAQQFSSALNQQLNLAAKQLHLRTTKVAPLVRGLDVCGFTPAFWRPGAEGGPGVSSDYPTAFLHPNRLGQTLFAAAVAKRLYF